MTSLRRPQVFVEQIRPRGRMELPSPNRLQSGRLCDGCGWPDRCMHDRICWHAEKQDIAKERST